MTPNAVSEKKAPLYQSLSKFTGPTDWDAIVVGSGAGGMACAAALAKVGKRVLVLEQHYVPGGFTHTFSRKGFTWDVGVHCVGEMGANDLPHKILSWLSNGKIEWKSMGETYERFSFPGNFSIDFPSDWRKFKSALEEKFPDEKAAIDKYFALVREISNGAKPFFALRTLPEWAATPAAKLLGTDKWWEKTTAEVLDTLTSNEKLKAVFTAQWGYYGSTPKNSSFAIHALTVRHFWQGGYYPVGSASTIADGLLGTVCEAGGAALVRAPVDEILVKNGKAVGVKMKAIAGGDAGESSNGTEFRAPIVVSAAGVRATLEKLLPQEWRETPWAADLLKIGQSPPHICLYLGFEGDVEAAGATRSNQWFFESWDMELAAWDVTKPDTQADVLYVSFPSLKDPHHEPGPNNRHTGEVVTFVPWEAFEKWKNTRRGNRDPEYMEFKKSIETRLLAQLKRHIPKLMERVVHYELSTPLSTVHFTAAPMGAIYGMEATPERFLAKGLRARTPVKNLFLAGGDVATLGVTGALIGGMLGAVAADPKLAFKLPLRG